MADCRERLRGRVDFRELELRFYGLLPRGGGILERLAVGEPVFLFLLRAFVFVARARAVLGEEGLVEAAGHVDDRDLSLRDEILGESNLDEDESEAKGRNEERRDPEGLRPHLLEVLALDDGEELGVHDYLSSSAVGASRPDS